MPFHSRGSRSSKSSKPFFLTAVAAASRATFTTPTSSGLSAQRHAGSLATRPTITSLLLQTLT
eukprot:54488-Alexandrium_andersonii.AAC.1